LATQVSCLDENKAKNRYTNVLPADRTIVKLPPLDAKDANSGYINANWIKGYNGKEKTYVACQGPLAETVDDFWNMIWTQQIHVIVMLTREEENDTIKCYRYWPNQRDTISSPYWEIQWLSQEDDKNNVVHKRTLRLKNLANSQTRDVTHFQYTEWPDYGVPSSPYVFMQLIHDVDSLLGPSYDTPLCVHCSAGIGRTGTFFFCAYDYESTTRLVQEQRRSP